VLRERNDEFCSLYTQVFLFIMKRSNNKEKKSNIYNSEDLSLFWLVSNDCHCSGFPTTVSALFNFSVMSSTLP